MRKISYLLLAVIALFVTASCNNTNPPVEDTWERTFRLKIQYNGQEVVVKNGDSFVFSERTSTENLNELGFHGKLLAQKQFKLMVDLERQVQKNTTDELCIGECKPGGNVVYGDGGVILSIDYYNQMNFAIRALELEAYSHCTPLVKGDNIITYTFYDNQEPDNKLTFKVNYKLPE